MSIDLTARLQEIYNGAYSLLNQANQILSDRGGETANDIYTALQNIASLPDGDTLARIALEASTDGAELVDLKLDSSWGNLRPYAFYYNSKIRSIDLSGCENMTEIPDYCFNNADNINDVKLPKTIRRIGEKAYSYTGFTELCVPASVTTLGINAFREIMSLEKLTFEDNGNLEEIPVYTFATCPLKEVSFGTTSKVKTIRNNAFLGCPIQKILLPQSLEKLEWNVLSANHIYFQSKPTIHTSAFKMPTSGECYIYVPWSVGEVAGAPWGATNATITYDCPVDEMEGKYDDIEIV